MKIYLAGPYSRKDEFVVYAEQLRASGIEVTSTWLEETHKPTIQMSDLDPAEHRTIAVKDVNDVGRADAMVLFTDPTQSIVRQGRTAELGMGVAIDTWIRPYPIFVVGILYENIFHHMPNVRHFATFEEVVQQLKTIQSYGG